MRLKLVKYKLSKLLVSALGRLVQLSLMKRMMLLGLFLMMKLG